MLPRATRRGRTSARPTCASCRASPRACVRCSSRLKLRLAAVAVAARRLRSGGGGAARRARARRTARAAAADRLLRRAAVRDRAARRPSARVRRRAGRHDPRRARRPEARHAVPGHQRPRHVGRRAGPAVDGVRARLRDQRPVLRLLHGHGRRPARRRVPAPQRRPRRPGLRAPGAAHAPTPSPTTTAASCCSAPTSLLYIGTGDGGGGGDQHGARGNGQSARHAARQDPAHRPAPLRRAALLGPAREPVRRPRRRAGEIYSYGLRNPWRFSFDRRDRRPRRSATSARTRSRRSTSCAAAEGAGANFGWRAVRGPRPLHAAASARPAHVRPVITERHADGNCSITGGVVIRDPALPALARALRLRRLLPRRARRPRSCRPAARATATDRGLERRARCPRSARTPGARLRHVARRPGLPAGRSGDQRCIRAPNPSPLTLIGTNTWVVGRDPAWVVDPGPGDRLARRGRRGRGAARGGAGGIALTHCARRPLRGGRPRCSSGSAACRRAALADAGRRRHVRPVRRARTSPATPTTTSCSSPAAPRSPATPCSARAACSSAGRLREYLDGLRRLRALDLERICPGHGDEVDRPGGEARRVPRPPGRARAQAAGARWTPGSRDEDELLDAAWDDAPRGRPPVRRDHAARAHGEAARRRAASERV